MLALYIFAAANGGMAERFNAPVLKTDVLKGTGGSNPSSSAKPFIWEKPGHLWLGFLRCGPVGYD